MPAPLPSIALDALTGGRFPAAFLSPGCPRMAFSWFKRPTPQFMTLNPVEDQSAKDRIPADLWHKCVACGQILLRKDFIANLSVCPSCGRHERVRAKERILSLVDEGSFRELDAKLSSADPLQFEDKRKYTDYVAASRKKAGVNDAVIAGTCRIGEVPASIAVMDFAFMGGSMGSVVGEKVARAMERALEKKMPCITAVSTGGARMQEGILSLMQMAKTAMLCWKMDRDRVPFIVILSDPSTAGVMASFGSLGDIIIAEPGAYIGFAGRRVIENTIRQKLPANFQTSEFQRDKGFVDMVVPRHMMRGTIVTLLRQLTGAPPVEVPAAAAE
jgi:acetyl-CoA carboxylase carboxyl transferase subunit beta